MPQRGKAPRLKRRGARGYGFVSLYRGLAHVSRQLLLSSTDKVVDAGVFQLGQESGQNIIGVDGTGHQVEGVLGVDVGQGSSFGAQLGGIEDEAAHGQSLGRVVVSGEAIPEVSTLRVGGRQDTDVAHTVGPGGVVCAVLRDEGDGAVAVLVVGEALGTVVHHGHQLGVGVQQVQEHQSALGVRGGSGDGDHSALAGGAVHVGSSLGNHADVDVTGGGEVQFAAEGVGLGAEQVLAGGLGSGTVVVGGSGGLAAGGDEALLGVLIGLRGELGKRIGGELVHDGAADVLGGMLGVVVVGQDTAGGQVAGDDGGMGDHSLKNDRLDQQGVEILALLVLGLLHHFGELIGVVVQAGGADSVHVVAQLSQQGAVDIPAVLSSGVLQAGNGIDAQAVVAVGLGAVPDVLGNGGLQLGRVSVQHVVQLDPVAVLGVLVVLVGRPVAGEVHIDLVAAGQGGNGSLIEVAPGAPDRLDDDVDLVLQISIDGLHDLLGSVGSDGAAVEPDLQGDRLLLSRSSSGGFVVGSGGGSGIAGTAGGQTEYHYQSQQQGQ